MRHERQDPRWVVRAAHERPPGAERRLPFTREEGGFALSWRTFIYPKSSLIGLADGPLVSIDFARGRPTNPACIPVKPSGRWYHRGCRSPPVTRHQVFRDVGLQHVGCASAQRSHALSVAAV